MPEKEKKTEDIKEYRRKYRAEHPKDKEETNKYMKQYIKNAEVVECPVCKAAGTPGQFKTYAKYRHDATQKHIKAIKALISIKDKEEIAELKKKEEEAQAKALAHEKKTPTPAPRKKKEEEKKTPTPAPRKKKEEEKKTPTPAPRKKKEESPAPAAKPVKKKKKLIIQGKAEVHKKSEALSALSKYDSDAESSSSSESEEEEEEKEEDKLKKVTFKFQSKTIDSSEVAEYIKKHFEESANPNRPADTKTKRLNKDASLWKKVSAELNGKTWRYVGENFGAIVRQAYEKPTSQADLISLLKRMVMHFSKVPKTVEKQINELARKLKESHTKSTT